MKFPRILTCLFYMTRPSKHSFLREVICARDTASLDFKKAKELIVQNLFAGMAEYNPFGPRDGEYKTYQKLKWIGNNLAACQNEIEQIEAHSVILSRILKWVQTAHSLRVQDCENRRYDQYRMKCAREAAIRANDERTEKMNAALEEA